MSVKKLLVLSAAGLAAIGATAAMAGGPDHMAMPAAPAFQNSIYVDGHVGYTQSNWSDFNANNVMGTSASSWMAPTKNGKGGVTGGVDMGYNVTQHIAVEAGWFHIPQVKGAVTAYGEAAPFDIAAGSTAKVNSWFAYMAAKLTVPVMENLDLFGKVGVAYRAQTYSLPVSATSPGHGHYWAPVFATGMQYTFAQDWMVGAQYMHLAGNSKVNPSILLFGAPNAAPSLNQYTAFVGYKFNV